MPKFKVATPSTAVAFSWFAAVGWSGASSRGDDPGKSPPHGQRTLRDSSGFLFLELVASSVLGSPLIASEFLLCMFAGNQIGGLVVGSPLIRVPVGDNMYGLSRM